MNTIVPTHLSLWLRRPTTLPVDAAHYHWLRYSDPHRSRMTMFTRGLIQRPDGLGLPRLLRIAATLRSKAGLRVRLPAAGKKRATILGSEDSLLFGGSMQTSARTVGVNRRDIWPEVIPDPTWTNNASGHALASGSGNANASRGAADLVSGRGWNAFTSRRGEFVPGARIVPPAKELTLVQPSFVPISQDRLGFRDGSSRAGGSGETLVPRVDHKQRWNANALRATTAAPDVMSGAGAYKLPDSSQFNRNLPFEPDLGFAGVGNDRQPGNAGEGDLYLEADDLGKWVSTYLSQQIIRPRSGIMAIDPRITPSWGGPSPGT